MEVSCFQPCPPFFSLIPHFCAKQERFGEVVYPNSPMLEDGTLVSSFDIPPPRHRYTMLIAKMTEYEARMDKYRSRMQRATNEARIEVVPPSGPCDASAPLRFLLGKFNCHVLRVRILSFLLSFYVCFVCAFVSFILFSIENVLAIPDICVNLLVFLFLRYFIKYL